MMTGRLNICHRDKVAQRHIAQKSIDLICNAYGVSAAMVMAPGRSQAHISLARQVAIYLAHVVGQLSLKQLSVEFGRDRTTISHACHIVEDRRDSPMFDKQISYLEVEYEKQIIELYRNWLSVSSYYHAGITKAG